MTKVCLVENFCFSFYPSIFNKFIFFIFIYLFVTDLIEYIQTNYQKYSDILFNGFFFRALAGWSLVRDIGNKPWIQVSWGEIREKLGILMNVLG